MHLGISLVILEREPALLIHRVDHRREEAYQPGEGGPTDRGRPRCVPPDAGRKTHCPKGSHEPMTGRIPAVRRSATTVWGVGWSAGATIERVGRPANTFQWLPFPRRLPRPLHRQPVCFLPLHRDLDSNPLPRMPRSHGHVATTRFPTCPVDNHACCEEACAVRRECRLGARLLGARTFSAGRLTHQAMRFTLRKI